MAKDNKDGSVMCPAHTAAMELAMTRHEETLKHKAILKKLQEADHKNAIETDMA